MKKTTTEERETIIPVKYILGIIAFLLVLVSKTLADYKETAKVCEAKYTDLLKEIILNNQLKEKNKELINITTEQNNHLTNKIK
jgi:hypothetical protein